MLGKYLIYLKKLKFKHVIYPIISVIFFAAVIFVLVKVAIFLSVSINKMFLAAEMAEQAQAQRIDLENYLLVSRKLSLPEIQPASSEAEISPEISPTGLEEQVSATSSPEISPLPEDKTLLKLAVFNSTAQSGLAAALKETLTAAGFSVVQIGNQPPVKETTLLQVKPSKRNYENSLREIFDLVSQNYQPGDWQDLAETEEYDVVVVIGED